MIVVIPKRLSTQLIIWGMVAFIVAELIAITCLLRYCCRARYLKRRKFKEVNLLKILIKNNQIMNYLLIKERNNSFGSGWWKNI